MSTLYMFPPTDEPPEDGDVLAGEYVLGVLDPGEAVATRLRAEADASLRDAILAWHGRLAPLASSLTLSEPPPALWSRLAAEIGVVSAPPPAPPSAEIPVPSSPEPEPEPEPEPLQSALPEPPEPAPELPAAEQCVAAADAYAPALDLAEPPLPAPLPMPPSQPVTLSPDLAEMPQKLVAVRWFDRLILWRATTVVALALAAGLAIVILLPRTAPVRAIAAMGPVNAPAPLFLAEADTAGHLSVTALATIAVPSGRDLELWIVAPGSTAAPTSLGVLPPSGRTLSLGVPPAEGTQLLISMEPRGGAPSGKLTGPVLYGGTLANH